MDMFYTEYVKDPRDQFDKSYGIAFGSLLSETFSTQ